MGISSDEEASSWARSRVVFMVYVVIAVAVVLAQGFRQNWGWALIWAIILGVGVFRFSSWRQEPRKLSR